jgi:hypothetical protein
MAEHSQAPDGNRRVMDIGMVKNADGLTRPKKIPAQGLG